MCYEILATAVTTFIVKNLYPIIVVCMASVDVTDVCFIILQDKNVHAFLHNSYTTI